MEKCLDVWFRYKVQNLWNLFLEIIVKFVGVDVKDMVFVVNVIFGINIVFKCIDFNEGDGIFIIN